MQIFLLPLTVAVPFFVGSVFDRTHAYTIAFIALGSFSLAGTLSLIAIRRGPFDPNSRKAPTSASPQVGSTAKA